MRDGSIGMDGDLTGSGEPCPEMDKARRYLAGN
jgi:hypothetical protein